ncbi:hypothetical protein GCM10010397_25570 [Streptomyces spinoverrucosus]|nr:hypothetical protein GCM10010397_25570 [Streptomyces spinoverrucosus]
MPSTAGWLLDGKKRGEPPHVHCDFAHLSIRGERLTEQSASKPTRSPPLAHAGQDDIGAGPRPQRLGKARGKIRAPPTDLPGFPRRGTAGAPDDR